MRLLGGRFVKGCNSPKHSKATQCGMNKITRLKLVTFKSRHLKTNFHTFDGITLWPPSRRLQFIKTLKNKTM
jgi:hypothetical protein